MLDIWGFLLQTLSVSGAALLILAIKALFRDKLYPKWQFALWSVVGIAILIPVGIFGRYTLFRWHLMVEIVKSWFGVYSFTRVLLPFPVISSLPQTVGDWVFALYTLGVILCGAVYIASYVRLRLTIRGGRTPDVERLNIIRAIADEKKIKLCKVLELREIPSAFVCGIVTPVLVIPADKDIDEKVILHEFFHLKNKDTLWSAVICALKCLHWCNPFVAYCARRALNDMESRCDQYVLEELEGEARREYGHILLSMANERYSKTPASTCIGNGGRNIKERIENISRFKKYPKGMGLVSVCVIIVLAIPLAVGAQPIEFGEFTQSYKLSLASARSTPCTTYAGAFDTYAKAVLKQDGYYRAMCAPENMQKDILDEMGEKFQKYFPEWDTGIDISWPDTHRGYYIYNLRKNDKNAYEGLLVIKLNYAPDGFTEKEGMMYLATQKLRVEKQNGRWVTLTLGDFEYIETLNQNYMQWGCDEIESVNYSAEVCDIRIDLTMQTIHTVAENFKEQNGEFVWFHMGSFFDTTPKPNAKFTSAYRSQKSICTYTGEDTKKNTITQIGISAAPVFAGEGRPEALAEVRDGYSSGSNSAGEHWASKPLEAGWESVVIMDDSGGSINADEFAELPEYFAADLYLNEKKVAELDLKRKEETK